MVWKIEEGEELEMIYKNDDLKKRAKDALDLGPNQSKNRKIADLTQSYGSNFEEFAANQKKMV